MAKRTSGKKLTVNELILQKLKETFDRNENVTADRNGTNVWIMLVAANFSPTFSKLTSLTHRLTKSQRIASVLS